MKLKVLFLVLNLIVVGPILASNDPGFQAQLLQQLQYQEEQERLRWKKEQQIHKKEREEDLERERKEHIKEIWDKE